MLIEERRPQHRNLLIDRIVSAFAPDGKTYGDFRTLSQCTLHIDFPLMIADGVFDDGQPEPCPTRGLRMTLIHTVKPLEHSVLMLRGNAKASILNANFCIFFVCGHRYINASSVDIVFNRVVAKVTCFFKW